jgi:uncharacterized membrane protein YhaH (DUF805 family)
LVSFLFSFRGRINRLQYWAGSLGVGVGAVVLIFVLALVTGVATPMDKHAGLQGAVALIFIMGLVGLLSGWAGLALQTKRFHDRGQPGWLCLLPLLPAFGLTSTMITGVLSGQAPGQFVGAMQPYLLALWAINFFFFINLGCLAGTDGPNKYGPPPGAPRSPHTEPAPRTRPPAQASLGGVEAAMERAIAEKARQPAPPLGPTRPPAAAAPALAAAAPATFGRRPAR